MDGAERDVAGALQWLRPPAERGDLGARGRVPKGGEWVMSQRGLSCDLGEFDVIVFNAREPHSLARFHGAESDWGGERY